MVDIITTMDFIFSRVMFYSYIFMRDIISMKRKLCMNQFLLMEFHSKYNVYNTQKIQFALFFSLWNLVVHEIERL
jgi:hypothetical protein